MAFILFDRETREELKRLGPVLTIGLEIPLLIAIGFLAGSWLDGKFGTEPWLMWICAVVGLAAAGRSLYRVARWAEREMEEEDE